LFMGMFDDIINEPASQAQQRAGMFDDIINEPTFASRAWDTAKDIGASAASGLGRGVAAVAGVPGVIGDAYDWVFDKLGAPPRAEPATAIGRFARAIEYPSPQETIAAAERAVPALAYEPQTAAGRYARTIGELVPGAMIGPGGAAGNLARYAVAPGVVTQGARDLGLPGPVPEILGAATGIGAGLIWRGGNAQAERAIRDAAGGLDQPQIDAAEALMRDAQSVGLPLTRAEAVQHVTNGATRLADLQRVVEGQGGLREFMAQRPGQVEQAGRQMAGMIAPIPQNPSIIGPQVAQASDDIIRDMQTGINQQTRPLYAQAEPVRIDPATASQLVDDPIYAGALREVRGDPTLNRTVANLPDDAVGVVDLVQRRLRERAGNVRLPGQADSSNLRAANLEATRQAPIQAADAAAPAYQAARAQQEALRVQYLEPLMSGPIGRLANKPETRAAIEALFPRNPVPNSAGEVLGAVQQLSARNPMAARQLVRAHVESVFNQATRDLQSGVNQFGGATFAASIRGNQQQAENLAAAINGLPNGANVAPGFNRLLDIMAATGQRQRIGSQTAFNQEMQAVLKAGGMGSEAGVLAAGVGMKLPARIYEAFQRWNLGRNTDEIARLLTDPQAAPAFRNLALARHGSQQEAAALTRLVNIASEKKQSADRKKAAH
jgi:hypothetical protein